MKHFNKYLFALLTLSSAFLTSCGDDEEKLAKQLTIDGEKETLSTGYIISEGYDIDDNGDPISEYYILLAESDFTLTECDANGSGTVIQLYLSSPSTYKLENGTYTFIYDENETKNTVEGNIYLNYDSDTDDAEEYFDIVSGTLTVSKSGNSYKIKISNLVLRKGSDGSEVDAKGSWEGSLLGAYSNCG